MAINIRSLTGPAGVGRPASVFSVVRSLGNSLQGRSRGIRLDAAASRFRSYGSLRPQG
ncbi:hypothetical protein GF406_00855 [candidate division KSB1 bacterium]|nr:hypothetical protein [candidate division KSB1 bacterium]